MSAITSVLQYAGLIAATAIGVFSLFYTFTEDIPHSQRKKLTKAGKYALALVIGSGFASLGATITKDVLDNKKDEQTRIERQRESQEIRLLSTTFEKIEIKLRLDESMSWRDAHFLPETTQEELCGGWSHLGVLNGIYADWCLSKSLKDSQSHGDKRIDTLYVDTRQPIIAEFIRQNYPALSQSLPLQLPFFGRLEDLQGYHPPDALYFSNTYNDPATDVRFEVPDILQELKFENQKFNEIDFLVRMRMSFAQIMDTTIRLGMSVSTSDVSQDGLSIWTRRPTETPFLLQHLVEVDVYLNGRLLKRVYDRRHDHLTFAATSEWALKHNNFGTELVNLTLDRDLIASSQAPPL